MNLAIVILNWNSKQETLGCLQSVTSINFPHFEIILVDNGSSEAPAEEFQELYPQIRLLRNEENFGFAEGCNRGIAYALERGADYVLLLNNDARVDPEILNAFMQAAEAYPDAGVFGAKIYYYDEPTVLWYAGGEVDSKRGLCYHEGCLESDLEKKWESIRDTGYACGCALFIRADVIQTVGFMDPQFFLIWEEIDWCWRIRAAGYRCLFVPDAKVWHKISASFEGGNRGPLWEYFYRRNRLLFLKRYYPSFFYRIAFWQEPLRHLVGCLNPRFDKEKRQQHRAALSGVCDYFRGRFGPKIKS
ncbi:MAG: glycosyltransferase family 2 protein [Chlamydiota bacterium]